MTYASFESSSVLMSKFMCPLGSVRSRWSLTAWQQRGTCFLLRHENLELLLDERSIRVVRREQREVLVDLRRLAVGVLRANVRGRRLVVRLARDHLGDLVPLDLLEEGRVRRSLGLPGRGLRRDDRGR